MHKELFSQAGTGSYVDAGTFVLCQCGMDVWLKLPWVATGIYKFSQDVCVTDSAGTRGAQVLKEGEWGPTSTHALFVRVHDPKAAIVIHSGKYRSIDGSQAIHFLCKNSEDGSALYTRLSEALVDIFEDLKQAKEFRTKTLKKS